LLKDQKSIQVIAAFEAVLAREIDVVDIQVQAELLLDRRFERWFGKRSDVLDRPQVGLNVVQVFAPAPVAGHQGGLAAGVPAGQLQHDRRRLQR